jgi:hypothetical protein
MLTESQITAPIQITFVVIVWRLGSPGHDAVWYGRTMTEAVAALRTALMQYGPIEVHATVDTGVIIAAAGPFRGTILDLGLPR